MSKDNLARAMRWPVLTGAALVLMAQPAWALECSVEALAALDLPGISFSAATPAVEGPPACIAEGEVVTSGYGAPDGRAGFSYRLPESWNGKFLMIGNGGLAGKVGASANKADIAHAEADGYVTAMTDLGHGGGNILDASFATNGDGSPNEAALADYYFRASHIVAETGKALAAAVYGEAPGYSYLSGCSTGGRMAQVAATQFPDDFDGVISGAPFMDISSMLQIQHFQVAQLSSPTAHIPAAKLPALNAAVMAACDGVDGVEDGMIQMPAACSFEPESLICDGAEADDCLTVDQARSLRAYYTALYTDEGQLVFPGYSPVLLDGGFALFMGGKEAPADVTAAEPWGNGGYSPAPLEWAFSDHIIQGMVMHDPGYDVRDFGVTASGIVPRDKVAFFVEKTNPGNGSDIAAMQPFLDAGKKMILYHGMGDHALSPFRTVRYYDDLAESRGGFEALAGESRLFMVPDMGHCGGGIGPDTFDTLAALEAWVERGQAPESLDAVKLDETGDVTRSMPLCPYPAKASYSGEGDVNDAGNWACEGGDDMLTMGSIGVASGLLASGLPTQ